jgi:hypothetical protein
MTIEGSSLRNPQKDFVWIENRCLILGDKIENFYSLPQNVDIQNSFCTAFCSNLNIY